MRPRHEVALVEHLSEVTAGDILFLISCNQIVRKGVRDRFRHTLVIHASDVPHGRGFAPLNWQIIEGRSEIVVTLMEAADKVDSGDVWAKRVLRFEGHELFAELSEKLFAAELELMSYAVDHHDIIAPEPQPENEGSYYRKRGPEDSRIQPGQSFASAFDLIRASDPVRYPAFFEYRGYRYHVNLTKAGPATAPTLPCSEPPPSTVVQPAVPQASAATAEQAAIPAAMLANPVEGGTLLSGFPSTGHNTAEFHTQQLLNLANSLAKSCSADLGAYDSQSVRRASAP
jgi:methionyl-tRNA formyltransferase